MSFELGRIGDRIVATAETDGWWLRAADGFGEIDFSSSATVAAVLGDSPEEMTARIQLEILLDLEIAEVRDIALVIPWIKFGAVLRDDLTLPTRWTRWSPFLLSIGSASEIGRADFSYRYEYRLGNRAIPVERCGYFVKRRLNDQIFHVDSQTFEMVDAMDSFNQSSGDDRRANGWSTLASIKGAALPVGAAIDEYLEFNDVLVPSELSLDVLEHEDGSVSFVPKCPDVGDQVFREAFLRQSTVPEVYTIDGQDGRRVRLLIGPKHREVLERMKQVVRLRGANKESAIRQPERFFDGLLDAVNIEYGSRVIGIGDYEFVSVPSDPRVGSGFLDDDDPSAKTKTQQSPEAEQSRPTEIELPGVEGSQPVLLRFKDDRDLDAARDAVVEALANGHKTIVIQGKEFEVSQDAVDGLSRPPTAPARKSHKGRKFLLVYTNETAVLESDERTAAAASTAPSSDEPTLPQSIDPSIRLMPHQEQGISWMLRCDLRRPERTGVLLADDMGLGKTLQVLGYLAGLMEAGRAPSVTAPDGTLRFRPFLIVAPLILVENKTWENEARKSFVGQGAAFDPILVLHGRAIDEVRAAGMRGQETLVGQPVLDVDKLMRYRTVITTYETAVSYQHSLAQMRDGKPLWSVLVTDEAQRYKAPNTKVSHAVKAIASASAFRIASTGTPVENRLLDLWTIIDSSVQTALLGDRKKFSNEFERPTAGADLADALGQLRNRLLYDQPHAFLLRRSKSEVLELPAKVEITLEAEMSADEAATHRALIGSLRDEHRRGRHLAVLHQIVLLYQHPALLRGNPSSMSVDDLLSQSAKLRAVVNRLRQIHTAGEKVIVFARLLAVQQILSRVLEREFGIRVPVINGTTSRDSGYDGSTAATGRAKNARRGILEEFERSVGFAVVVLSPHVAGIGLTITAANHVIHYGRWWNPAVEAQATDRAYRIGQTKPVFVYLPILRYPPSVPGKTFDERLNDLMLRKTALRQDFLHPDTDEEANASELCAGLEADAEGSKGESAERVFDGVDLGRLTPQQFEAAVAALFKAEGFSVVLTARSSDGGADVVAAKGGDVLLVQAKHSKSQYAVDEVAIGDVVGALDIYGRELASDCRAAVVTNATFSQAAVREAGRSGIELLSGDRLLERIRAKGVGFGAMSACDALRCGTFAEGVQRAKALLV